MLIASLNLVGAALLVFDEKPGRAKWRMLGVMSLGAAALVLTTAPLWMSFLHDLSASFRLSEQESVWQIPRSWLLGFFDDMFLQQPFDDRRLVAPSMNLVFFLGTAWFLVHFRSLRRDTTSLLSITGALAALALAFRWMPAAWILAVPGLRLVGHVHNTFAGVAVVLLLAPSSSGLALAWDQLRTARARARFGIVCFIALTLLGIYFADVLPAWTQHPESPTVAKVVAERGYFFLSVALVALCLPLLLALARSHARDGWSAASTFFGIAIGVALLARHGMHVRVPHDDAFLNITARPQADARSPAVEWLRTNAHAPARVLGTNGNLFAGASALYGIEGVNGPDALVPRAYRELVRASGWDDPRDWHFPTTVDAIARQHRLLDMLNVRYFVSAPGDPPPLAGLEARADLDLSIFENPTAWPRAFFTTRVARGDSADDVIRQLRDGDGKPFAAIDVDQKVSFPEGDHADASEPASEATDFALTANTTTFTIESPSRGIAVVTEGGSPDDFRATVDGQPAPVLRVNHAFKGVLIDSTGRHRIKLVYWPRPLAVSLWLAAAGVVLLGTSLWCAHALTRAATGTRKQAEAGA